MQKMAMAVAALLFALGSNSGLAQGAGDAERGAQLAAQKCTSCHHAGREPTAPEQPRIAGQVASYLAVQLDILRSGIRPSRAMNEIASGLSDRDIEDLAAYWGGVGPAGPAWDGQDAFLVERGRELFMAGNVGTGVIACVVCHGKQGQGVTELAIPRISGQAPAYLTALLQEFSAVPDFGQVSPNAMHIVASALGEADIRALVAYLASQPWGSAP